MKIDRWFLKNLLVISLICLLLIAILLIYYKNESLTKAILAGFFLAVFNVTIGYLSIEYAHNKSITKFMKVLIGGMSIRLLILIICLLIFISIFNFHIVAFISSLFVFYIIFLIFEIVYIEKRLKSKIS
ncbi:MAG: ATP synthase protein I2 [Ignavibacteriae bacterium]|nr:MAG: ATP synthase protein I2 [Ignavibacteriota bacterium]